jgi:hypothetical protein
MSIRSSTLNRPILPSKGGSKKYKEGLGLDFRTFAVDWREYPKLQPDPNPHP